MNHQGLPKSRPKVGADRELTTPLDESISVLIEPVAKARPEQWEAQSTEEVLRIIKETNNRLREEKVKDVLVGSLDVEALYPSIDQIQGPKIVAEEVLKSSLQYDQNISLSTAERRPFAQLPIYNVYGAIVPRSVSL